MKTSIEMGRELVYDPVRRKWVILTPEEHVRQSVLEFLFDVLNVPISLTGVEYSLTNIEPGNRRQVDILVWKPGEDAPLKPWLLVECKAPSVKLTRELQYQIGRYLSKVPSELLMLTNGEDSRYYRLEEGEYKRIDRLPLFAIPQNRRNDR